MFALAIKVCRSTRFLIISLKTFIHSLLFVFFLPTIFLTHFFTAFLSKLFPNSFCQQNRMLSFRWGCGAHLKYHMVMFVVILISTIIHVLPVYELATTTRWPASFNFILTVISSLWWPVAEPKGTAWMCDREGQVGYGHGTELPDFGTWLDNTLSHIVWFLGGPYVKPGVGFDVPYEPLPTWDILFSISLILKTHSNGNSINCLANVL